MREQGSNRSDSVADAWHGLGLDHGAVGLAAARPEWRELAERLAEAIREKLGGSAASVEHIGSSAVPGLAAKR